ncbi:MAG: HAD-IIIC family phosphatase [Rhodospirillales bacterium]|nr:HAD-IIIC family phosphatase [Rhodospirillales bacterium]
MDPDLWQSLNKKHRGAGYLDPTDLQLAELHPRRVAMIGSCQMALWGFEETNPSGCPVDMLTVNNIATLPDRLREDVRIDDYDFQIIQLLLRFIVGDMRLPRLRFSDRDAFEHAFAESCRTLQLFLDSRMRWNKEHGLLTFVVNFCLPQGRMAGRLLPRYDLRNISHFVYRLNEYLETCIQRYEHCHLLDMDEISASFGRRYCQDDAIYEATHGGMFYDTDELFDRIEPTATMQEHYGLSWYPDFPNAVWAEALSMFRSLRQIDAVKLVVVDLDDTLWEGISGDIKDAVFDDDHALRIDGWPTGLAEALLYLRQRGILLAIISKNDEARIRALWPEIYGDCFRLDDFAVIRINWRSKTENMRDILDAVNLLPQSVVFIDDHPVERAAMAAAFPDMRILGRNQYYLSRILAWSAETQSGEITEEAAARTAMVQSQIRREDARATMRPEAFLARVAPVVTLFAITDATHPRFARMVELLNRTNQFNTTGERRSAAEIAAFLADGGRICAFEVRDTFTRYGLVGLVLLRGAVIEQWVMSCRVLGLGVEAAVGAALIAAVRRLHPGPIVARLRHTGANFPCRGLYTGLGFLARGDLWVLPETARPVMPAHVRIEEDGALPG